jgi:hypothetical protein
MSFVIVRHCVRVLYAIKPIKTVTMKETVTQKSITQKTINAGKVIKIAESTLYIIQFVNITDINNKHFEEDRCCQNKNSCSFYRHEGAGRKAEEVIASIKASLRDFARYAGTQDIYGSSCLRKCR